MAKAKQNGNGSEGGKYIRVSGLWKNGKILLGNNIRKRVAQNKGVELSGDELKDSARFRIANNDRKSIDFMSNDSDAHLLIESKHIDEVIEYLQMLKQEHNSYWDGKK